MNSLYVFLASLFGALLGSYFKQKGKNIATKEDVSEITAKIEDVKHEYAQQLESTKAELSSRLEKDGFRYQKEYEILSELNSLLVDVRDAAAHLRPVFEFKDPEKSEEQIKREKLSIFKKCSRSLYLAREKNRPFFPEEIYYAIKEIDDTAYLEAIGYEFGEESAESRKNASINKEKIFNQSEKAMELIRKRVVEWESIVKR